jgi:putative tryptophan/tyrosine transport system substrate-binding protein
MRRREFIAGLGAAAWPLAARAQLSERMRRVGVLMSLNNGDPEGGAEIAAFRQGLAEHGWIEGRTIDVGVRWGGGNIELIDSLAKELVELKPDVLLSRSTPGTAALKRENAGIPVVFVNAAEPVEQGFVQGLARPGGNITGFTNFEASVGSKMLQLLMEIDPRIVRVVAIFNPQTAPFAESYVRPMESAFARLGVQIIAMPVQSDSDIEAAMIASARQPGGGLIAIPDSFTMEIERRDLIIALARRMHLPAVYWSRYFTRSGGLMAYAVDPRDLMHRAADYVDRILRGAKPADLPVQQPTKFELVINLKTAKALGLTVPLTLLALADEVIE